MTNTLTQQVAIVTGAANGIGFSIAEHLASVGARVMLADVNQASGKAAADRLTSQGYSAGFTQCDVADVEAVAHLIAQTQSQLGDIDILVNNAGIVSQGDLSEVDLAHWQRLLQVNLTSVFLLSKTVLPHMIQRRRGRIINIASVAGQQGGGLLGNTCYAATKGGVIAFTKGLAREGGPFQVTANVICPALTETEMTKSMPDEMRRHVLAAMPLGRAGTPLDIAQAVGFLASDAASFITGVTLNVDGGFMRH